MAVAVVGELVVAGGELLQALRGDGGEVAGELGVLGQHHGAPRHERVDQRLLPHRLASTLLGSPPPPPPPPPTDSAPALSLPPVVRWSSPDGAGRVGGVEKGEEGGGGGGERGLGMKVPWEGVERKRGRKKSISGVGGDTAAPRGGFFFLRNWSSAGRGIMRKPLVTLTRFNFVMR